MLPSSLEEPEHFGTLSRDQQCLSLRIVVRTATRRVDSRVSRRQEIDGRDGSAETLRLRIPQKGTSVDGRGWQGERANERTRPYDCRLLAQTVDCCGHRRISSQRCSRVDLVDGHVHAGWSVEAARRCVAFRIDTGCSFSTQPHPRSEPGCNMSVPAGLVSNRSHLRRRPHICVKRILVARLPWERSSPRARRRRRRTHARARSRPTSSESPLASSLGRGHAAAAAAAAVSHGHRWRRRPAVGPLAERLRCGEHSGPHGTSPHAVRQYFNARVATAGAWKRRRPRAAGCATARSARPRARRTASAAARLARPARRCGSDRNDLAIEMQVYSAVGLACLLASAMTD